MAVSGVPPRSLSRALILMRRRVTTRALFGNHTGAGKTGVIVALGCRTCLQVCNIRQTQDCNHYTSDYFPRKKSKTAAA